MSAPRPSSLRTWLAVAAAGLALGGCASVREATPERDNEAKQFGATPGSGALYIFRNDFADLMEMQNDVAVYMDGRIIGQALPGAYFRVDTRPGNHVLHGFAHDQGNLKISTRPGEITYISLHVVGGTSVFKQVAPEAAKREIARCCVLMENWAPGQRPLLR